jgi:Mn-containing catalase
MSTLTNYTFQSFNFRGREAAKPEYDLISNIGAEEHGHIGLVAATVTGMLTGAAGDGGPTARWARRSAGSRAPATRTTSSSAARARCRRTRSGRHGRATTCSTRATWRST